ncbi:Holliday junction branch migration protein RuvA [Arcanobacterium haemolyticum]|nr:Holliday junction branch migration protein RuvA [Arcanobacterium haemolyticum]
MISVVRGEVLSLGARNVVVDVGGLGFQIQATPTTLSSLREGSEAVLHTSLVVREDSLTLFGFADADERDTFDILQGVSGIGPRIALAVLSVHTPDALRAAVANEDTAALQRVPGIGKKGAQRLILELATKLGPARGSSSATNAAPRSAVAGDVVEALIGLGWPERDAAAALDQAQEANPGGDVPTLLRASLQVLGNRR